MATAQAVVSDKYGNRVRDVKVTFGAVVPNRHKVPLRMWRRWTFNQQSRFNAIYDRLLPCADVICPPGCEVSAKDWAVIAWNAAWLATDELEA